MSQSLYSCRHSGDQYRITKLDADLNVESSYLCSPVECECPGFESRGSCRHLKMLPRFISHEACDGGLLYNFDSRQWVRNPVAEDGELITPPPSITPTERPWRRF